MSGNEAPQLAEMVGRAIAKHRAASNLTQEEVAEQLGIGNEAVSRIERGVTMPTVARLVQFADIFGCKASDLLMEGSTRPNDQARQLERMISGLSNHDRTLVLEIVERLAGRLHRR